MKSQSSSSVRCTLKSEIKENVYNGEEGAVALSKISVAALFL